MWRGTQFGRRSARPAEARTRSIGRTSLLTLAGVVLLGACSHQGVSQEALSGDQIRTLITGNTLQGSILTERLVMVFYADGVVRGQKGLTGSDSGTWEIDGDKYCNEWFTYFKGIRRCYRWIPQGDGYVLDSADEYKVHPIRGRIVEGKPKGY